MDNHEIIFKPEIQREGAELIKKINKEVAEIIGINQAARTTCVKPAGSTSCLLGTASGIHPHHAKRYFRRVQANKLEFPLQEFMRVNPLAVEQSVWSNNGTDMVITFLCEVPQGSITKNQLSATGLLENVKKTQQNWVEYGTTPHLGTESHLRHNVSNTITVETHEWDEVEQFIYDNKKWFAGISLLPASGDKDYPQAPFCTVYTPTEVVREHGDGSVFASGVIVNALNAFDNNLWKACDAVVSNWQTSTDVQEQWLRQAKQFADRYFEGNVRKMTYCLKDVHNWKSWCDLKREYKEIDWSQVIENSEYTIDINTTGAQACAGGQCTLI
jgi:ribonucleoside-triphosphate reductase (thioredoxin)